MADKEHKPANASSKARSPHEATPEEVAKEVARLRALGGREVHWDERDPIVVALEEAMREAAQDAVREVMREKESPERGGPVTDLTTFLDRPDVRSLNYKDKWRRWHEEGNPKLPRKMFEKQKPGQ